MRGSPRWILLAALVLLACGATAQEVDPAPPVEIEDVEIPDLVVPLDEPGQQTVTVRVGCEAHEVPNTETRASLNATDVPKWANVIVSPSTLNWLTSPEHCPSTGMPFEGTVQLSVATTQDAPAYQEQAFALEADVVKKPPAEAEARTYGPYRGNVSFTPGYFHQHNVRVDEKIKQADPGQTLAFEGTIHSFANHETAFTLEAVEEPEGFAVSYDPERLVLDPQETGLFAVEVAPRDGSQPPDDTVSVKTQIHGASTHELGGETGTSQVSMLAKFQADRPDPRDQVPVPAASTAASLAALAAVALAAAARTRGRP